MQSRLRLLFLVAEAAPFIKVGGLGDVGGSLPPALKKYGGDILDIRLVIPHHPGIALKGKKTDEIGEVLVQTRKGKMAAPILACPFEGLTVYLIGGKPIKSSTSVYQSDARLDGRKYTFFSLAALELTRLLNWKPDIVHANDWHTSPAIVALATIYRHDAHFSKTKSVLTLHNLPYMGNGHCFAEFGLKVGYDDRLPEWAQNLPLPLGILNADKIVAVSPNYAQEIMTDQAGCGLQALLSNRKHDIHGILNGLDYEIWNPDTDIHIQQTYSIKNITQRQFNKSNLQQRMNLSQNPDIPLFGMVTRLDPQKGADLAFEALRSLPGKKWQLILVGTGNLELETAALKLQADFPDRVRTALRYDDALAHQVYAGADVFLMPSRYEPCGLAQMIAMHYGCIPVATRIGGLSDTIIDRPGRRSQTGFLSENISSGALAASLERAIQQYLDDNLWRTIQKHAMRKDFSWIKSAQDYLKLYQSLV
jgi:starch synthase